MAEELSAIIPDALERRVRDLLKRAKGANLSIAAAESCTGGLLSSLLTDVEGVSSAFERGFVVYSVAAKCDLLGIARERIESCGAVSKEVALAMVDGALDNSQADIAVAITGFAGRAGPGEEPGLVHLACRGRGAPAAHREEHFGDVGRGDVRIAAVTATVAMLEDALSGVA